jgi:hypothetical protein
MEGGQVDGGGLRTSGHCCHVLNPRGGVSANPLRSAFAQLARAASSSRSSRGGESGADMVVQTLRRGCLGPSACLSASAPADPRRCGVW